MKLIYIAGPFRAKDGWRLAENVRRAEAVGMEVARVGGCVPLIPHTMFHHFDRTLNDEFWVAGTIELLRRCDAIVMCRDWSTSTGSRGERELAMELGMPAFFEQERLWIGQLSDWLATSTPCAS